MIWPRCTTAIWFASMTVESRWAMSTTVQPDSVINLSNAFCTKNSFSASSAEVASSKKSSRGLRRKHRAMAKRCLWPPERRIPRSPTRVSYPSSCSKMNSCAFAALHASKTSSFV
mmetsp:Transcript_30738/g.88762  ORF Transcript_30738/g.88762 Transcript_30738/m.88762 type:complete len:115 (+) Transcript_30738:299-643(+)